MDNMDFCIAKNWTDLGHVPFDPDIIKKAVDGEGLYVFDMHPLHVALNTRSFEDYAMVKDKILKEKISPFDLRFKGRGAGVFFEELCRAIRDSGQRSIACKEALNMHLSK